MKTHPDINDTLKAEGVDGVRRRHVAASTTRKWPFNGHAGVYRDADGALTFDTNVPYRAQELAKADRSKPVHFCKDEETADAVGDRDTIATTISESVGSVWPPALKEWFRDRIIIIRQGTKFPVEKNLKGIADVRHEPDSKPVSKPPKNTKGAEHAAGNGNAFPSGSSQDARGTLRLKAADQALQPPGTPTFKSARADTIKMKAITWIWPDRFAEHVEKLSDGVGTDRIKLRQPYEPLRADPAQNVCQDPWSWHLRSMAPCPPPACRQLTATSGASSKAAPPVSLRLPGHGVRAGCRPASLAPRADIRWSKIAQARSVHGPVRM